MICVIVVSQFCYNSYFENGEESKLRGIFLNVFYLLQTSSICTFHVKNNNLSAKKGVVALISNVIM